MDLHTYIHPDRYVNTLLSVSVILVHFPRTSEPANTHAYFLCVLYLPSTVTPVSAPPPQPNAPTHTGFSSRASPSGFPLGGFCSPSSASRGVWRHYYSRELFLVSPVFPERPMNTRYWQSKFPSKSQFAERMWRHSLLMPPGKKTKNTLACVFTVVKQMYWERAKLGTTVRY